MLTLYVPSRWGGEPWAILINMRIHRKPEHEGDPRVLALTGFVIGSANFRAIRYTTNHNQT